MEKIAFLLLAIYHGIWEELLATGYLQVDETPVKVLDPEVKWSKAKRPPATICQTKRPSRLSELGGLQAIQARLLANQQAHGGGERTTGGAVREGPALLQGLVLCGKCGRPMTPRYHQRGGRLTPDYVCAKAAVEEAQPVFQSIPGRNLDEAVGRLLAECVTPLALEVALKVQEELQARLKEADRLRQQHVQRHRRTPPQRRLQALSTFSNLANSFIAPSTFFSSSAARRLAKSSLTLSF